MPELEYPIGIQTFEDIRRHNYVYVDKTGYIPGILKNGKYKFLSRPRRFGKSLLLSTLEAFFSGRRDLFAGLAVDAMIPQEWESYPVLHLDMANNNYDSVEGLEDALSAFLVPLEEKEGILEKSAAFSKRFELVIRKIYESTGKQIVVLIDEYDSPITSTIGQPELQEKLHGLLHSFYSTLKSSDKFIRFCMLTGVTKYGKMSVFSGLNNLNDISYLDEFAGICGITEDELHTTLADGVRNLAAHLGKTEEETYALLKYNYDGYHFSERMLDVYNPFSLISTLANRKFSDYWFETATPTMLVKVLENSDFDIENIDDSEATMRMLSNISTFRVDPIPLFFQTGYLTLKGFDAEEDIFRLGFPNHEVEKGFWESLLPIYTKNYNSDRVISDLRRNLKSGDVKGFIYILTAFFADIPFDLRKRIERYDNYYHSILYTVFRLLGMNVNAEYHTSEGSIDLLLTTDRYIYIIELKINGTAAAALSQINAKGYARPFAGDQRRLIKLGIGFSRKTHTVASWLAE